MKIKLQTYDFSKSLFKSSIYALGTSIMARFLLLPLYTNVLDANGNMYGTFVLVVTSIAFGEYVIHGVGDGF